MDKLRHTDSPPAAGARAPDGLAPEGLAPGLASSVPPPPSAALALSCNVALWLAIAAGLSAAAVLVVDSVRPVPAFCVEGGGCDEVRRSAFASLHGVKLAWIGLPGFALLAALSLWRGRYARVALLAASGAAALAGFFLIGLQVRMQHFCPFCLIVDGASVVAFAACGARWALHVDPPSRGPVSHAIAAAFLASAAAPLLVGAVKKPVLPEAIAREVARAPKGKALVVDFVDYECPFCRENHAAFAAVLQAASGRVVVVRKQVPLTRMHRHAMDAARAACCGEVLGKGDPMSDALISAPVAELTPQGCERLAQSIGLDVARFRACVADPSTDARIASDIATFQASNGEHHGGLPTLWIGHQKLEGLQDRATLERAVARAIEESS